MNSFMIIDNYNHNYNYHNDCTYKYDYDYNHDGPNQHHFLNKLTTELIPLTLAQYRDDNYTIERARQT